MKTRVIRIGFKDMRTALKDFVETGEALIRGEEVKEEAGVYFTNIEAFRKAITPRRLGLLNVIKTTRPGSINELNRVAGKLVSW